MGRAPWPVTVVLRLVSPGAKQVGRPEAKSPWRRRFVGFCWGMDLCILGLPKF